MKINWYPGAMTQLAREEAQALEMTAEAIRTDLIQEQTIPFASAEDTIVDGKKRAGIPTAGELQQSTTVDRSQSKQGKVSVVSDTPYARRLYYHPEYRYYRGTNKHAGGLWFEPYKKGEKKKFVVKTFAEQLRRVRGQ